MLRKQISRWRREVPTPDELMETMPDPPMPDTINEAVDGFHFLLELDRIVMERYGHWSNEHRRQLAERYCYYRAAARKWGEEALTEAMRSRFRRLYGEHGEHWPTPIEQGGA